MLDLRATPPSSRIRADGGGLPTLLPQRQSALFGQEAEPQAGANPHLEGRSESSAASSSCWWIATRAGSAEVIAAVLRTHVNAMVIGQQTRGEAVEFAEFPLASRQDAARGRGRGGAAGQRPRLSRRREAGSRRRGRAGDDRRVAEAGTRKGRGEFVFETERPRMNEAALVAGTNPELDAIQAAQKAKGEKAKPALRDAVLQRAVDFITTISLYEKKPGKK